MTGKGDTAMHMHRLVSCALVALVLGLGSRAAIAQDGPDPEEIAQACIQEVMMRANHRANHNAAAAAFCVERIEELLAAGEVEQAFHVAARCINRIRHRSRATAHVIRVRCVQCRHLLLFLGAPELAALVGEKCQEALLIVRVSKAHAVAAIRDALPDP